MESLSVRSGDALDWKGRRHCQPETGISENTPIALARKSSAPSDAPAGPTGTSEAIALARERLAEAKSLVDGARADGDVEDAAC